MTTSPVTYSIQIANQPDGSYDVMLPLPKPYHTDETGLVVRHQTNEGHRVLGFMSTPEPGAIALLWSKFETRPAAAVGKFLVLISPEGEISSFRNPVSSVRVTAEEAGR